MYQHAQHQDQDRASTGAAELRSPDGGSVEPTSPAPQCLRERGAAASRQPAGEPAPGRGRPEGGVIGRPPLLPLHGTPVPPQKNPEPRPRPFWPGLQEDYDAAVMRALRERGYVLDRASDRDRAIRPAVEVGTGEGSAVGGSIEGVGAGSSCGGPGDAGLAAASKPARITPAPSASHVEFMDWLRDP